MSSRLFLFAAITLRAFGQAGVCYVGDTSAGCPATGTPTVASYIAGLTSSYATMWAAIAPLPQPVVAFYPNVAIQASDRAADTPGCQAGAGTCVFSTASPNSVSQGMEAVVANVAGTAMAAGKGIVGIWYNADTLYWSQAPSYAAYCAAGSNICATPVIPTWMAWQRTVDRAWLLFANVTLGLKIRISLSPLQSTFIACGLNPTDGSITATTAEECINPLAQAMVTDLAADGVTVEAVLAWHEAQGYLPLVSGFTPTAAQFTAMLSSGCAAIHAATSGSGVQCGGGFTAADGTYSANYAANATSDDKICGLETYGGKTAAGYAASMATLVAMAPACIAAGMTVSNSEGNPTVLVDSSAPSGSEANARAGFGCANPILQTYGATQSWLAVMPHYLSAYGFSSVTWFGTEPAAVRDPRSSANCYVNTASGSASYEMLHTVGATPVAVMMQSAATWPAVSVQGFVALGGKVAIQ